jgi:hypothetical protein
LSAPASDSARVSAKWVPTIRPLSSSNTIEDQTSSPVAIFTVAERSRRKTIQVRSVSPIMARSAARQLPESVSPTTTDHLTELDMALRHGSRQARRSLLEPDTSRKRPRVRSETEAVEDLDDFGCRREHLSSKSVQGEPNLNSNRAEIRIRPQPAVQQSGRDP